MHRYRRHPFLIKLALFAAMLMAFAPGVSRMLAEPANPVGSIVEAMCTKVGMQYISLPMSIHDKASTPAAKHAEACGYCALLGGTALLAVALLYALFSFTARVLLPRLHVLPIRAPLPRGTLGSRGPPLYA